MKRMILVCWLCFAATSVYAEIKPDLIADPKSGCQVWIPFIPPSEKHTVRWSIECNSGKANGTGTIEWHVNGKPVTIKGLMKDGQCIRDCSQEVEGKKYVGEFEHGNLIGGIGTMTYPDGKIYSGEWKDGNKNGRGTMSYPPVNNDNFFRIKRRMEKQYFSRRRHYDLQKQ